MKKFPLLFKLKNATKTPCVFGRKYLERKDKENGRDVGI
jgi:hypothetical protein